MPARGTRLDDLPPVIQLILRELPFKAKPGEAPDKPLKRLLPELRRQAEWTMENWKSVYGEEEYGRGLVINPSAGLDPFSQFGKCPDIDCRILNAQNIARTLGLYADVALIGDPFTDHVLLSERWTRTDSIRFMHNLVVFGELRPLFEMGIIRLVSNFGAFCEKHKREFEAKVRAAASAVLSDAIATTRFEVQGDVLKIFTDQSLGVPMGYVYRLNAKEKRRLARASELSTFEREYLEDVIGREVHETLFKMNLCAQHQAVTFSNSRISVLAARQFDSPPTTNIEVWEASRSTTLPWVSNLSPHQVLELREQAHRALPRFRKRMARALTTETPVDAGEIVRDLREEAMEVQAELDALDVRGEHRFRNLSGLLGMTVAVYGFAGEFLAPGTAVTGLATLLGLLHSAGHKERQEVARITSRPGYVLVKAKELAEHAAQPNGSNE